MARPCQAGVEETETALLCKPIDLLSPIPKGDWQNGLTLKIFKII